MFPTPQSFVPKEMTLRRQPTMTMHSRFVTAAPPSLPPFDLSQRTPCNTSGCFPRGQITTSNSAASALSGSLSFWFNGQQTATALDASGDDATVDECETVSSTMPPVFSSLFLAR